MFTAGDARSLLFFSTLCAASTRVHLGQAWVSWLHSGVFSHDVMSDGCSSVLMLFCSLSAIYGSHSAGSEMYVNPNYVY
jgi:hypothetical protein